MIQSAKEATELIANHLEAMESLKHKSTTVIRCKCQECIFAQAYLACLQGPEVRALIEALDALCYPDGILYGPMTEGPELDELNKALAQYRSAISDSK